MDLLADPGVISYDGPVTNDQLWSAVGHELRSRRLAAGYSSTIALATAIDDVHAQKTFDKIEAGGVGRINSVHRYCAAVGATLADVLRSVLPSADLSARAVQVASAYDREPEARPLVDMALRLPPVVAAHETPQGPPDDDRSASAGGSRGPGRKLRHHR